MTRQERLIGFVKEKHSRQVRKYTNEPYFNHLKNVARLTSLIKRGNYATEIAYCHDLIEDTTVTDFFLLKKLVEFGYPCDIAYHIVRTVVELTDYYTKTAHPDLNRNERKELEVLRMRQISPIAQNIKICDIIDNTKDFDVSDVDFVAIYIKEKRQTVNSFFHGQSDLIALANDNLDKLEKSLKNLI